MPGGTLPWALRDRPPPVSRVLGGATAYLFDGASTAGSDYVDAGNSFDIVNQTTGALTIAVWVKTLGYGANQYQVVANKGDPNWRLENVTYSQLGFANNYSTSVQASGYTDNNWHFAVATFDGANLTMYRDGYLAGGPVEDTGGYNYVNTNNIWIGANSTGSGHNWDGGITQVAFFSYALSPSQVLQLWSAAQGIAGPGIVTQPVWRVFWPAGRRLYCRGRGRDAALHLPVVPEQPQSWQRRHQC